MHFIAEEDYNWQKHIKTARNLFFASQLQLTFYGSSLTAQLYFNTFSCWSSTISLNNKNNKNLSRKLQSVSPLTMGLFMPFPGWQADLLMCWDDIHPEQWLSLGVHESAFS